MNAWIPLEALYVVAGLVLLGVAGSVARDAAHPTRWTSALFWLLFAATFLLGKVVPPAVIGYCLVAMVALAAFGRVGKSTAPERPKPEREASAARLGNRIFLPAALLPLLVVVFAFTLDRIHLAGLPLATVKEATLVGLGLASLGALAAAIRLTGARAAEPGAEGGRLLQSVGWALILPQLLAALGGIFAKAGVGEVVSGLAAQYLPTHLPFVAVLAYCLAMALFTMAMGNAFAAFAVITGGIGLPFIVQQHGGNPAIMAALGMLAGYCGTLCTPMAANFNLVPAILLELEDRHAVIKAQLPYALTIFLGNALLMWLLVYR
ncbi:MAG: DUF979 domain-containing protein [Verrucomicrobia bacterium]|nr:DUF979 domain-containing protein [Verrucomicrobiota bacterium]